MAITTTPLQVPETTFEAPSEASKGRLGVVVGWAAAGVAVGAAGLLAVAVLTADESTTTVDPVVASIIEHGSITAIDHAAVPGDTVAPWLVEAGSITAIDHVTTVDPVVASVVEHGSITAIDHAAEAGATVEPWVVERGSINAIDHAAE